MKGHQGPSRVLLLLILGCWLLSSPGAGRDAPGKAEGEPRPPQLQLALSDKFSKDSRADYAIQGEYASGGPGVGAQVIALGGGDFELVWWPGGLPGTGDDGGASGGTAKERRVVPGHRDGADVVFEDKGVTVVVDPDALQLIDGTEVDFVKNGLNEAFSFRNPNVTGECGCGESFNI